MKIPALEAYAWVVSNIRGDVAIVLSKVAPASLIRPEIAGAGMLAILVLAIGVTATKLLIRNR